jgi:hypothetical protein
MYGCISNKVKRVIKTKSTKAGEGKNIRKQHEQNGLDWFGKYIQRPVHEV